jgi:hypothetical protein
MQECPSEARLVFDGARFSLANAAARHDRTNRRAAAGDLEAAWKGGRRRAPSRSARRTGLTDISRGVSRRPRCVEVHGRFLAVRPAGNRCISTRHSRVQLPFSHLKSRSRSIATSPSEVEVHVVVRDLPDWEPTLMKFLPCPLGRGPPDRAARCQPVRRAFPAARRPRDTASATARNATVIGSPGLDR